ncbi:MULTISPECIES: hypothetical protein [Bacteria]|uniref:hypothetical protein n=1 Tax=Bacteria TaxID=2 RepID=UPI003C7C34AE
MATQLVIVDGDWIELPIGHVGWDTLEVATRASAIVHDVLSGGAGYELEIVYDASLGRFVAEAVKIERAGEGTEVTSRLIREVTVQEIIAEVALSEMTVLRDYDEEGVVRERSGSDALGEIAPAAGREPRSVRYDARLINTLAKLGNWPPLVTIANRLSVSHSTAKRLIAKDREAFPEFTPTEPSAPGRAPSQDWLGRAATAANIDELRRVYQDALDARELNIEIDGTSLKDRLLQIRDAFEASRASDG